MNGQKTRTKPTSKPTTAAAPSPAALAAGPIFQKHAPLGKLDVEVLPSFLEELAQAIPAENVPTELEPELLRTIVGSATTLTLNQARTPLKKALGKYRSYLETGSLAFDEAVAAYMVAAGGLGAGRTGASLAACPLRPGLGPSTGWQREAWEQWGTPCALSLESQPSDLSLGPPAGAAACACTVQAKLDEHRRKCESEGRYAEARAASQRLVELKTAQVSKLRSELLESQAKELAGVSALFEEETAKFNQASTGAVTLQPLPLVGYTPAGGGAWDEKVNEFEQNFAQAVEDLKATHDEGRARHGDDLANKRPVRPKPSREYLNQKKIEESLAKNRQYVRAIQVKEAADELFAAEMEQTQAAYEAEQRLRMAKFVSKQQAEFEALLQRGARGRDELELRRCAEVERRSYRFRNVVAELESLHKLEVVQLENFLDAQVQAGKASPLKDASAFRRKREALYNTAF
ncbi:predicted protein [Haematococcus lacustris]|uniref:Uncharacterized protein n=1 Tax=Haematococcus lacustris TaxID=44745 RepID=A0A6A0A2R6_HAELA|nr:predicted protein [Haematococcus lacustris]